MEQRFYDALQDCPIIAAVRDEAGLDACLASDVRMVFTLFGDVCSIPTIVDRIRAANKFAVVHLDRVTGLASKEVAVDFIRQSTRADGVISTHTNLIQYAKSLGLFTALRAFLIDSIALDNLVAASRIRPDALDILPGLMPPMIRRVREQTGLPALTGGLITQKAEILQALEAGALAISTTARPYGQCKENDYAKVHDGPRFGYDVQPMYPLRPRGADRLRRAARIYAVFPAARLGGARCQ